jgi:hypothetical protein
MPEFAMPLMVIGLIGFAVILCLFLDRIRAKSKSKVEQNQAFSRLAKSFGGRVLSGPEWFYHSLHFPYRDGVVSLGYVQGTTPVSSYWTYIVFEWSDKCLKCEIRPQSDRGGMPSLPGTWKVLLDEPPFDADYYLAASDKWQAANLLTWGVRERLHELFWLRTSPRFSRQSIYVRVTGGQLFIAKPGMVTDEEVLREFIELSLGFYNEARLTCIEGIEFGGTQERFLSTQSLGEETHCHVCGDPFAGHIVYCRSCKTPHHLECWNYFGGCGTYGCGEKRYMQKSARASA